LNITENKIILIVDNPSRDLPSMVLVANCLTKNGHQCFLVPSNLRDSEVFRIFPDFVLVNHIKSINNNFIKNLFHLGIKIGVLDTEGGVFSPIKSNKRKNIEKWGPRTADDDKYEEYLLSLTNKKEYLEKVSVYFSWNEPFANWLITKGIFREDQVVLSGIPRADFFHENYKEISQKINGSKLLNKKRYVLINSSFCLSNPKFNDPLTELNHLIQEHDYPEDYAQKLFDAQKFSIDKFFILGIELAKDFPETNFVYRPHPFENEEYYQNKFNGHLPENLSINSTGTVDNWLNDCLSLIHFGSSTAIEATVLGKSVYLAGWLPRGIDIPLVEKYSKECADYNELKKNIEQDIKRGNVEKLNSSIIREEIIKELFYKIDGKSHERVADGIINYLNGNNDTSIDVREARAVITNYIEKCRPGSKLNILRKLLVKLPPKFFFIFDLMGEKNEWDRSKKAFTLSELNRMIRIINHNTSNNYLFQKVTNYSDYISPNRFPRAFKLVTNI
jgi:surface carbohydrate biosynthesis protein